MCKLAAYLVFPSIYSVLFIFIYSISLDIVMLISSLVQTTLIQLTKLAGTIEYINHISTDR